MSVFDQVKVQPEKQFVRSVGVSRQTFYLILGKVSESLSPAREKQPMKKRGKKFQISLADRFLLMLLYIQHYLTFAKFGLEFGISEPYAFKIYDQMVSILVKELRLKSRKHPMRSDLNVVVIDVTEQPIERPPKGQAAYHSGRKQPTIKAQLIVDFDALDVLSVVCCKGRLHDLRILKKSWVSICPSAELPSDVTRSYQENAFELNTSIGVVKSSESPKKHIERSTRILGEAGMWSVLLSTRDICRPAWQWILSAVNNETQKCNGLSYHYSSGS